MSEPTVSEEASVSVQSRPTDHTPSQPSPPHSHEIHSNHSQSDSDHTHSEDEGLLDASATGDEVTQMLRKTVEELELALEDSRKVLGERDNELVRVRGELERYRQQAAREIANKTKLAQNLDESHTHAQELEELLQQWQLELREAKTQNERLEHSLHLEQSRCQQLEAQLSTSLQEKDQELDQLKTKLHNAQEKQIAKRQDSSSLAEGSNPGVDRMDKMQLHFLKQAVFHLLTDFHAEDQLRAIISILDFSAQERKAVYAKVDEKKKYSRGIYL